MPCNKTTQATNTQPNAPCQQVRHNRIKEQQAGHVPEVKSHRAVSTHRFNTHGFALRAVEVICAARQLLEVDVLTQVHLPRVDLHDARARVLVGVREFNLAVEAA